MKVRVRNGYWEYYSYYDNIIKVEEKSHTFILYAKNGFIKEFDNGVYTYYIEEE